MPRNKELYRWAEKTIKELDTLSGTESKPTRWSVMTLVGLVRGWMTATKAKDPPTIEMLSEWFDEGPTADWYKHEITRWMNKEIQ